jgi:flagellar M-ring protein FliF
MSPSPWSNLIAQAKTWWEGSSSSTRIGAVGFGAVVIFALVMATMLASAPTYENLFSNLSPDDAAAIAAKLDDEHAKYQLADNDTTVLVPSTEKDRLRMEMVRAGLPAKSGSVLGTEWLDKIGMSTTSDVQDQYIRLANEGELSRTIGTISSISSASVHISQGDNTPFAVQTTPTTASAVIGLKIGATLSSDQIMGIAALISKSVPGLDIKNVAVIDTNGNQLWSGGDDPNGPGGSASGKISAEQNYSEQMRKQMQSYLDQVLGPHKALVSVAVELNYNQVKSDAVTYGKGAIESQQSEDETYSGGAGASGGIAGTTSNTPVSAGGSYTQPTSGKNGKYDNSKDNTSYSNDKTETQTQQAQGQIQRLAVGVLVDNTIPPTTVSSIKDYLSTLAGATTGDTTRVVSVQTVAFSNVVANQAAAEEASEANAARQSNIIKFAALFAFVGVMLFIFKRSTAMRSSDGGPLELTHNEPREFLISGDHPENMVSEGPIRLEDVLDELPEPTRLKKRMAIPEITEQQDIKLEGIREMIASQPQSVANLLKGWMSEDQGS